jgi:hypothetical protein
MKRLIQDLEPDVFYFQSRTLKRHFEIMSLPIKLGALALGVRVAGAGDGLDGTLRHGELLGGAAHKGSRHPALARASKSEVIRLLLSGGLRLVAIGAGVGMVAALLLARLLQGLSVRHQGDRPAHVRRGAAGAVVGRVPGAWLPARRAGNVDPQTALRSE